MEDVLAPLLKAALIITGPLDLKNIMAQSLQMGDELHTRNVASSLLLLKELGPSMVNTDFSKSDISASINFIVKNQLFFLNIAIIPQVPVSTSSEIDRDGIMRKTRKRIDKLF